ncbi:MAG: dienelactone hydrolase family protein [Pseudomonadota bacterium]|nr:dienelactone hydrolase family protein [Pseudomonadota bacterium]
MCDKDTVHGSTEHPRKYGITRRQFSTMAASVSLLTMLPPVANAQAVTESEVEITTPDGVCDAYFVHPSAGASAAVLMWPDIFGLRASFRAMGKRLAESGYAVLVVNPFYRIQKAPTSVDGESFADPGVRDKLMGLMGSLTAETNVTDAKAFVGWLDQQSSVDTSRKVGTMGYCMGGPIVMRTAAALPDRVGAGGSFHGGGLTTQAPDSPHLLIPQMKASMLIAIAKNDDAQDPTSKDILRKAFDDAGVMAEIEVYEGDHGWCVPDSAQYHEAAAEKAWERMLAIFETQLA